MAVAGVGADGWHADSHSIMVALSRYNVGRTIASRELGVLQIQASNLSRRKVCLVGFEESIQPQAPLNNRAWEIWTLNMGNRIQGFLRDDEGKLRVDRWFDLHQEHAQDPLDLEWIHSCPVPIYLTDMFTPNPMALRYPLETILRYTNSRYFCSSFAYMLCLAVYEGFDEIMISGINLNFGRELAVERGNLEYWIGYFRGQGKNVYLQDTSKLCQHGHLYGFEYTEEKEMVEERMAGLIVELLSYPSILKQFQLRMDERRKALEASGVPFQTVDL